MPFGSHTSQKLGRSWCQLPTAINSLLPLQSAATPEDWSLKHPLDANPTEFWYVDTGFIDPWRCLMASDCLWPWHLIVVLWMLILMVMMLAKVRIYGHHMGIYSKSSKSGIATLILRYSEHQSGESWVVVGYLPSNHLTLDASSVSTALSYTKECPPWREAKVFFFVERALRLTVHRLFFFLNDNAGWKLASRYRYLPFWPFSGVCSRTSSAVRCAPSAYCSLKHHRFVGIVRRPVSPSIITGWRSLGISWTLCW